MSLENYKYIHRPGRTLVGNPVRKIEQNEIPLDAFDSMVDQDFLSENVGYGETIGSKFYPKDLAKIWSNPILLQALLNHPQAMFGLRLVARNQNVKIEPVKVSTVLANCLGRSQDELWSNNIETVEDLVSKFSLIEDEIARQDIGSAFLSAYGINLFELLPSHREAS